MSLAALDVGPQEDHLAALAMVDRQVVGEGVLVDQLDLHLGVGRRGEAVPIELVVLGDHLEVGALGRAGCVERGRAGRGCGGSFL
jgi:hypothetical protein